MTKGVCPAAGETAVSEEAIDNGAVVVTITWQGDGTSLYPTCNGPVQSIVVTNNSTTANYYAHFPQKTKGTTVVQIPQGTTTLAGTQLKQAGLDLYSDTLGVVIDTNPNPE